MKVYMSLSAMYRKIGNLELFEKYLVLVENFPDDVVKNEPHDSRVRKSFTDLKKMAREQSGMISGIGPPKIKTD
jgi:hypothetical protein